MKIYKHYFDKADTPYVQKFQPKKKYHTVWKHNKYSKFLNCKVKRIKLFGIFTVYEEVL